MALERFVFDKKGTKLLRCNDKFIEQCIVPAHITSIGPSAFAGCEYLREIKLPDTLLHINQWAFYRCSNLEEIKLPDGLRSIGDYTFYQTGLKKILIPAKVKLGKQVFDYTQLKEISFADGRKVVPAYMLTQYSPRGLRIILPDTIEKIDEYAFWLCDFSELKLPEKLKYIGKCAFRDCSELKELHLPDSIEIEEGAFCGCKNLELYIPSNAVIKQAEYNLDHLETYYPTFSEVKGIHLVNSESPIIKQNECGDLLNHNGMLIKGSADWRCILSVEYGSIGASAFEGNLQLERIFRDFDDFDEDGKHCDNNDNNNNNKIIFPGAFKNCKNLTFAELDDFYIIGKESFDGCSKLERVFLENCLKKIGWRAFGDCSSLTSIRIPRQCELVDMRAFSGCSALEKITFDPHHIPLMKDSVFENCTSLKTISISDKNIAVPSGLCDGCASLTNVHIPFGIKSIGCCAFRNCTSLQEINLPDSIEQIGAAAFDNCNNLASINIPNSLKIISSWAFANCSSLTFLDLSNVESIGENSFVNCTSLKYVLVSNATRYRPDSFPEWCKVAIV